MSKIYTFRVLLDTEQEVFRDIEIKSEQTFEQLHHAIQKSFDFSAKEMASFYMSNDDWERGKEIPLMDLNYGDGEEAFSMAEVKIGELIRKPGQRMIYIYDFLRMWAFFVEMVNVANAVSGSEYPKVAMSLGDAPEEGSKDMDFSMETESSEEDEEDDYFDFEDDYDDEDLDNLADPSSY